MRILFVTPYIPSLIRVRPYNILHALVERGHQVTLITLKPPGDEGEALPQLRQWCKAVHVIPHARTQTMWNGISALPTRTPIQMAYSKSPAFNRFMADLLKSQTFDVAHVEHLRGAALTPVLGTLPIVFDSVDSIALLFEKVLQDAPSLKSRLIAMLDLDRTRHFEGTLTNRFPHITVTSEADRQELIKLGCRSDAVHVVPNGVDLDYFQPQSVERAANRLVFTGKMNYHANIAAVDDLVAKIMPLVWSQKPDTKLQIVGKDPAPSVLALAANPNVEVTGSVPDLRPYLAQASIAVSTIRYGVGIQNKVLEAMAMAAPVVCSEQACSALKTVNGQDIRVGQTPEQIANHIIDLLSAPEQRTSLGAAGRRYVERHHTWNSAAAYLEELYTSAAQHSGTAHARTHQTNV